MAPIVFVAPPSLSVGIANKLTIITTDAMHALDYERSIDQTGPHFRCDLVHIEDSISKLATDTSLVVTRTRMTIALQDRAPRSSPPPQARSLDPRVTMLSSLHVLRNLRSSSRSLRSSGSSSFQLRPSWCGGAGAYTHRPRRVGTVEPVEGFKLCRPCPYGLTVDTAMWRTRRPLYLPAKYRIHRAPHLRLRRPLTRNERTKKLFRLTAVLRIRVNYGMSSGVDGWPLILRNSMNHILFSGTTHLQAPQIRSNDSHHTMHSATRCL
ncbi:hypothetical protein DFH06DRAFT_345779 [Mycena polygramma]|nr:hypothetical protein DFH06DRAFT_345779 [Mycena polygramma]